MQSVYQYAESLLKRLIKPGQNKREAGSARIASEVDGAGAGNPTAPRQTKRRNNGTLEISPDFAALTRGFAIAVCFLAVTIALAAFIDAWRNTR